MIRLGHGDRTVCATTSAGPTTLLLSAALAVAFLGCGKKKDWPSESGARQEASGYEERDAASVSMLEPGAQPAGSASPRRAKKASDPSGIFFSAPVPSSPPAPAMPQAYVQARARMIHYSGRAVLRSTEPEKILDSAIAAVEAAGGFLEQRSAGFAALRVPAGLFDTLFLRLLRMAEVVDFNQEAEDISEALQDAEMRLKLVEATLERLEALVRKAKTESQKLRLLRELKRLREEREVLDSQRRELVAKARFASIHLWVRSHAPLVSGETWRRDIADFRWIHALNPYDDRRFRGRTTVRFPKPPGMVVSRKWRPWRATSSQGSEFWGSELEVDPRGDSRFWMEAVRTRLKEGFKAADTLAVGAFRFCRFQSFGPTPYYYWVGVRARGDELDLAEFYFPDEKQQARLLPELLASVEKKSR